MSKANPQAVDVSIAKNEKLESEEVSVPSSSSHQKESQTPSSSSATETAVGIRVFLGSHKGFSGILKQRFSDFLVNEIDMNGQVVHLTELGVPGQEAAHGQEKSQVTETPEADFSRVLEKEELAKFLAFAELRNSTPEATFTFQKISDKAKRTELHKLVRAHFPKMVSETDQNGSVVIPKQGTVSKIRQTIAPQGKKFVHLTMLKMNRDTNNAMGALASASRANAKSISMAGMKDKRGVTVQRISVHNVTPEKLATLNPKLINMRIGNFKYADEPLRLGDLKGNRFSIAVRDVSASDQEITVAVEQLRKTGFINYFGLQRFGTSSVSTHEVGIALLRGQWELAGSLVLAPRSGESPDVAKAREHWAKHHNAAAALNLMPNFLHIERQLLQGLVRDPKAYLTAFMKIPRTMRMMYVHAYQSYIWNVLVSERIEKFGFDAPVEGDLVLNDKSIEEKGDEMSIGSEAGDKIQVVTAADVQAKKYNISQVVIPLPGYEIKYPTHFVRARCEELLAKDGLDITKMNRNQKDFDLKGAYRKIITMPSELEWKIMKYDDVQASLMLTDADVLDKVPEPTSIESGKHTALILRFNLPTSSYATMLFREVLRQDTSIAFQKELNQKFDQKKEKLADAEGVAGDDQEEQEAVVEAESPQSSRKKRDNSEVEKVPEAEGPEETSNPKRSKIEETPIPKPPTEVIK